MNIRPYSPVEQDFIWIGEYVDGTFITEFNMQTKKENSFYKIKRDKLIRFGLIGHGMRLFYEVPGGEFKLDGYQFEFLFKTKDGKEYNLSNHPKMYSDIISYKDAESLLHLHAQEGQPTGGIYQYNFGYKERLEFKDETEIHFKAITHIPFNHPVYISFKLVSNTDLDGEFIIKKNGNFYDKFDAKISKEIGGELNWVVK